MNKDSTLSSVVQLLSRLKQHRDVATSSTASSYLGALLGTQEQETGAPPASWSRKESFKQMVSITALAPNLNNDCAADIILRALLMLLIVREEPAKQG